MPTLLSSAVRPFLLLLCLFVVPSVARAAGVLEVMVSDANGASLPGALVTLAGVSRACSTDAAGLCRFDALTPGTYDVSVRLSGFQGRRTEASVAEGGTVSVPVSLSPQVHFSESVTVSPDARDSFESYQPVSVLAGADLSQRLGGTLGDTLGTQPGVNVRSFGAGNARPVIRGFDGDRVLVLENGARTGDLSFQSGDHAVAADPAASTQIEVVRGPATLLYGSNAIGGVVNLVSDEIPKKPVSRPTGALVLQGGTANEEAGAAGNVAFGSGPWAFRVHGAGRRTADVTTPDGAVPNSQTNLWDGGGAVGYASDSGYLGVAYQYAKTVYGIPPVGDEIVELNPRRHRLDVRGEKRNLGGLFEGLKFEGAYRDYRHEETAVDTGEVGTAFHNQLSEGKLLLNHRSLGRLKGTLGFWGAHRNYSSEGEEALAPPTTGNSFDAFLYEELGFRHVSFQFGMRYDHTSYSPDGAAADRPELTDRSFDNVSASLGALVYLTDDLTLAGSFARAARAPSLEELYNRGPHPGNFAFEVGNPDLGTEVGKGLDLSLRYRSRRFAAEATYFRNSIDDYIFGFQTGEVEDGLSVINYVAADGLLQGFEAHADIGITDSLWIELGADGVRGRLRTAGTPLPRIPPTRGWLGLRYRTPHWQLQGEVRAVGRQHRVYGVETPTAGFALFNVHGSYTFTTRRAAHIVTLRVDNAGDRVYRNHLSYVKDVYPEQGRNVKLVYALRF